MSWRRGILVHAVVLGSVALGTLHAQQPGAAIFAANCAGCHGADGRGGEHAPNIATAPEVQHLMDRELAGIIRNGISGAGMPAFSSLKPQEVRDVVAWLRILQGRGDIVKLPGDARSGETLFFGKAQCSECHMVTGKGGFIGGDLSFYGAEARPDQIRGIILDPEKNLPPEKKATTVVTNTGQSITGMLRGNNNFSLSLQTPDGSFHFLQKTDLTRIDLGSRSLMPASKLDSKEVDDLVSYLLQAGTDNAKGSPEHASQSDDHDD
jgi:cytochrome c oxidase cbb3-type subunit III